MSKFSARWHRLACWLAIAGLLGRGLIPAGFMPAEAPGSGSPLVLCSAGIYQSVAFAAAPSSGEPAAPADHAGKRCVFAATAVPGLPIGKLSFIPGFALHGREPFLRRSGLLLAASGFRPPVRGPPARF